MTDAGATIVIVTYNSQDTIATCLRSLSRTLRPEDEAIVIDNASQDRTVRVVRNLLPEISPAIKFLPQNVNHGFSRGCNIGIEQSNKEFVILLNPDTEVFEDWIERMTLHFRLYPKTGMVGALSNNCLISQNITAYLANYEKKAWRSDELLGVLYCRFSRRSVPTRLLMGFCLALHRDIIEKYGALDENIFLGDDDLELSWRLREKGLLLRLALDVYVNHLGHASFETIPEEEGRNLVRQGSDVLYQKMEKHYGFGKIPHPKEYFNIGWWEPTILDEKDENEIFTRDVLPCKREEIIPNVKMLLKHIKVREAAMLLEHALKICPEDYHFWLILGSIHYSQQNYEGAELPLKNAWAMQLLDGKAKEKLLVVLDVLGKADQMELLFAQDVKSEM